MRAFAAGDVHVLVSTTVIEVGIDVPNATVMVVEHAERFGLAQLHQLRGRVGRGTHPSSCVLLYQEPLARGGRGAAAALVETTDGFVIAEKDLELRGPGDFFGTRQSGVPTLRVWRFAARSRDHGGGPPPRGARARARARRQRAGSKARRSWTDRFGLATVG